MYQHNGTEQLLSQVRKLNDIGIALSSVRDIPSLLERILISVMDITQSDGGTLYTLDENNVLHVKVMRAMSLGIEMGGVTGKEVNFEPIALYRPDGGANDHMVVVHAVLSGESLMVSDVYEETIFDFSGPKNFDKQTGYRSKSLLTIPMRNHENDIIGVLQLINKQDKQTGEVISYSREDQQLAESLASQAAVAMTNRSLIDDLHKLFEALTQTLATAIDDKSPYTGGHCKRVPIIAMRLADAVNSVDSGPLKDFTIDEDEYYAMQLAAWLHDCGKVTTPEYVVDKATKLETIFDRIHLIDTRFEVIKRDACIRRFKRLAEAGSDMKDEIEAEYRDEIRKIEADKSFIHACNTGGEFMSPEDQERIVRIGQRTWTGPDGESASFLSDNEIRNLQIAKGTLLPEEREVVNHHIVMTIKMLNALPFPGKLRQVPEYAGCHHEWMNGQGYPNGLTGDQMSVPARMMAIADIFEALTATDRPYKEGKPLSEVLKIMGLMKEEGHIDPDLFDIFIRKKVYLQCAREFLDSGQIDVVEPANIPCYST